MESDIVVRLQQGWLAHWDTDVRFVMVYASEWMRLTNLTIEAADEIERLRKERDEARREIMSVIIDQACRSEDIDREYEGRGWEYLKEQP